MFKLDLAELGKMRFVRVFPGFLIFAYSRINARYFFEKNGFRRRKLAKQSVFRSRKYGIKELLTLVEK